MRKQVLSLWFFTTISYLFAWIVLSVWMSKSHKMVAFLFIMTFGVYFHTNCFHVADWRFYTNTSRCTDLVYYPDLDILWTLPIHRFDEDPMKLTSDGSVRIYIKVASTNRVFTMERLIFPSLFNSFIFLVFTCVLTCFTFSVDEEFS